MNELNQQNRTDTLLSLHLLLPLETTSLTKKMRLRGRILSGRPTGAMGHAGHSRMSKQSFDPLSFKKLSPFFSVVLLTAPVLVHSDLHLACLSGNAMEGHRLFEAARRDPRSEQQIDSSVFHSLFTACASEGLGKLALKTLSKMRKMNFHPTRENLVCLMEAISKSKGEEGQLEQLAFVEEICFSAFWKQTHCFGMDLVGCYVRL